VKPMQLCAATSDWDPSTSPTLRSDQPQDLRIHGRAFELYQKRVRTQWGYQKPQQDISISSKVTGIPARIPLSDYLIPTWIPLTPR